MPRQTPSQTVGPFFSHALTPAGEDLEGSPGNLLAHGETPGEAILVTGRLIDGAGEPVADGMIEIWQADSEGRYPDGRGQFSGFGRAGTDENGEFRFQTIKPGPVGIGVAPHISVVVFARGMLNHAFTRIYFSDEDASNRRDPVFRDLDPERRKTLIAVRGEDEPVPTYDFTVHLQGERETLFFDA